jgi:hypothetical protein
VHITVSFSLATTSSSFCHANVALITQPLGHAVDEVVALRKSCGLINQDPTPLPSAIIPSALQFLRDLDEQGWVWLGRGVLVISLTVAALASTGSVINVSDATAMRADRTTPAVATAQATLDGAKKACDREYYRTDGSLPKGPVCQKREDTVDAQRAALDQAKDE